MMGTKDFLFIPFSNGLRMYSDALCEFGNCEEFICGHGSSPPFKKCCANFSKVERFVADYSFFECFCQEVRKIFLRGIF